MKAAAHTQARPIADIVVRERHRRDLGDIEGLAESIEDLGLLHAITINESGVLLAGARRLAAVKRLGWTHSPVKVVKDAAR
jgi:ParB family transcriptional regulator, chromosome partitioning protein